MDQGETPSVLALTSGRGDIRDAVMAVMLDDDGNIRTQTKFDNLKDEADRASFVELVERRKPKVVVVGGLSVYTAKLRDDAAAALRALAIQATGENPPTQEAYPSHEEYVVALAEFDAQLAPSLIPLVFVSDATARLYMNSEEAEKEHPTLPLNGRYALALARYAQNPLNAYSKLGKSIASVTFMEHHQNLVSEWMTIMVNSADDGCDRYRKNDYWFILKEDWSMRYVLWVLSSIHAWPIRINGSCCHSSPAWVRERQTP